MTETLRAAPVIPDRPQLRVMVDSPMSLHTTWRIGGPADFVVRAASSEDVVAAVRWARDEELPVTVIGGGSNLLAADRGVRGLVIQVRTPGERAAQLVSLDEQEETVLMRVGAQAPLSWVGRFACDRGYAGLDWAVGLPGTVGGATVNNAGAHGAEIKDSLESVTVLTADGEVVEHDCAWLDPRYRMTSIKESARPRPIAVLATTLRLTRGDVDRLRRLADEHADYRHQTQPTGACAGSTFTNPPGDFAGRLIEMAGLKGHAVGAMSISTKHSNFIVNAGKGTAAEVRELIAFARERVVERFGIELETEIEEIGEP